jgi:hypothetical protein
MLLGADHTVLTPCVTRTDAAFSGRNSCTSVECGTLNVLSHFFNKHVLFKRKNRMHRSSKQEGTRKGTLARTGGQKGGMFGESTGPVDYIRSDAPLGGN